MAFFFTKIFRNIILVFVLFNVISFYLRWKHYNILAKDFKAASTQAASNNALSAISKFQSELKRYYKGHSMISDTNWVPLSFGGLQLRAQFFYATPFEAVIIISAPSLTIGRSGFHWSNSTCTVLSGEITRYSDAYSGVVKESFTSGQNFRQGQFESYIYEFKEGAHLACYSRGFMPASSFAALTGALATGDPIGAARLIYSFSKVAFENMAVTFVDLFSHYKAKALKMEF